MLTPVFVRARTLRRAVLFALFASVVVAPIAEAAVVATAALTFPLNITPGQANVGVSIQVANQNTDADISQPDTVTSITLVPSCAAAATVGCAAASVDPGVFIASTIGTGDFGSACAGMMFNISEIDAASGKLQISPTSALVLPVAGSTCTISFTVDAVKLPTKNAPAPTLQVLDVTVTSAGGSSTPHATSTSTLSLSTQTCADIDGDGRQDALSDGLMLVRAMFGLTGASVVNGTTSASSTRTTWDQVRAHMNAQCGTSF